MIVQTPAQHEALVQSLMDTKCWPDGGDRRRIDTHISTVVLAGDDAYKLKKPLDLGFLDFLSLEARHRACIEELRLNSRHAPEIYQAVCAITGSIERPGIDGDGEIIDWAVRMRRFDPDAILSNLADRLGADLIENLADRVAVFHRQAAVCDPDEGYGSADSVYAPMQQNFVQIESAVDGLAPRLEPLRRWTADQRDRLQAVLRARKADGHVRECHGDLHLGNVALIDEEPIVFDAIEFNPGLRWIDTINDVAFLTMDLQERGRRDLCFRFLDRYLQASGDYEGLAVLQFYEVYRALVRAKIAAIRIGQTLPDDPGRADAEHELRDYLAFAGQLTEPGAGAVIITRGVSGSGKSHVSQTLPDYLPAVRLRSDVERKRLLGLDPRTDATARGAYSQALTEQTYARLAALARIVVEAGIIAVVDATFLKQSQRAVFRELADALRVPFVIVDCEAPPAVLRERIIARAAQADNVSDADLAVLEAQWASLEPLTDAERQVAVTVTPDCPLAPDVLRQRLQT